LNSHRAIPLPTASWFQKRVTISPSDFAVYIVTLSAVVLAAVGGDASDKLNCAEKCAGGALTSGAPAIHDIPPRYLEDVCD